MITLPVKTIDGVLVVAEPIPEKALSTALSPDGCLVYMPGDEELLASRLAEQEEEQEEQQQ